MRAMEKRGKHMADTTPDEQGWLVLRGYSCADDRAGVLGDATAKALQRSLNDVAWR